MPVLKKTIKTDKELWTTGVYKRMKKTLSQNNYPWPYFDLIKMYQQKRLIIFDDVKLAFNGRKFLVVQYFVSET